MYVAPDDGGDEERRGAYDKYKKREVGERVFVRSFVFSFRFCK